MTRSQRRTWSAAQKLSILDEARQGQMSVSEVCRRHGISAGQFYAWEKQAREGAAAALQAGRRGPKGADQAAVLETELTRLRAVIAELSAENLALKKGLWP
jgi:transposase